MKAIIERMRLRTVVTENGCWEYQHSRECGYGEISVSRRLEKVHRVSWMYYKGPIPDGINVLHSCDRPPCWNPEHLFLGDQQANMDDMVAKGRAANKSGMNNGNAALNEKQVLEIIRLINEGLLTQKEIGLIYNIAQTTVSNIKHCGWKSLKESTI